MLFLFDLIWFDFSPRCFFSQNSSLYCGEMVTMWLCPSIAKHFPIFLVIGGFHLERTIGVWLQSANLSNVWLLELLVSQDMCHRSNQVVIRRINVWWIRRSVFPDMFWPSSRPNGRSMSCCNITLSLVMLGSKASIVVGNLPRWLFRSVAAARSSPTKYATSSYHGYLAGPSMLKHGRGIPWSFPFMILLMHPLIITGYDSMQTILPFELFENFVTADCFFFTKAPSGN